MLYNFELKIIKNELNSEEQIEVTIHYQSISSMTRKCIEYVTQKYIIEGSVIVAHNQPERGHLAVQKSIFFVCLCLRDFFIFILL
jgi:hypothetical protein